MIKCIVNSWSYRVVELTAESIASLEADLKGARSRTSKREENQDINLELMLEVLRIVRFPGCDVSRISIMNIAQDKGGKLTRTISILRRCCEKESSIENSHSKLARMYCIQLEFSSPVLVGDRERWHCPISNGVSSSTCLSTHLRE